MSIIGLLRGKNHNSFISRLKSNREALQGKGPAFNKDENIVTKNAIDIAFNRLGEHAGDDNAFDQIELTAAEQDIEKQLQELEDQGGFFAKFNQIQTSLLKDQLKLVQTLQQNFEHLSGQHGDAETISADDLKTAAKQDGDGRILTTDEFGGQQVELDTGISSRERSESRGPGNLQQMGLSAFERNFYSAESKDVGFMLSGEEVDKKTETLQERLEELTEELNNDELSAEDREQQQEIIDGLTKRIEFYQGVTENFAAIDTDNSGELSIEEFEAHYDFEAKWEQPE